jgi:hypothetical protein
MSLHGAWGMEESFIEPGMLHGVSQPGFSVNSVSSVAKKKR